MRIVITKNGKIIVQELEEESSPSDMRSKIKSSQSSYYSKLPVIYTNEELLKKYSKKRRNEFIMTILHHKENINKQRSNSLANKKVIENFYNRDESKINSTELNQAKRIKLSHTRLNISQMFLDKYDEYDENFKKKLNDFSNFLSSNTKRQEEKDKFNNNINIDSKIDNNSKTLNNSNNINNIPIDSYNGINNNSSSILSLKKIKKINIGDIISKNNLLTLRNRISKINIGSPDVRRPLNEQNLKSFNFRTKYENKQATEDDMDLILNYGINTEKSSIIKYFQQNKNISPYYFENLLKYDEPKMFKLNKICEEILDKNKKEINEKRMRLIKIRNNNMYKYTVDLEDAKKMIKKTGSVINDYASISKKAKYWKLMTFKEETENIQKKYWDRYKVNRFLKNKQKIGTIGFPLTTTNLENKKLFTSQSSPDVINQ